MERGNGSFISFSEQYRHNVDKEMARRDEEKSRMSIRPVAKDFIYPSIGVFVGLLMFSWILYTYF